MALYEENWNINDENVVRDYIKGLSKRQILDKYKIPEKQYSEIFSLHENFIIKNSKKKIEAIKDLYSEGKNLKEIANILSFDFSLVSYFGHRVVALKEIDNIATNDLSTRKLLVHKGKCGFIADFWFSGGTESTLKDLGISKDFLGTILDLGVPTYDIEDTKDLRAYKFILAQAYDRGIITNEMLECVFEMDDSCAELLKKEDGGDILKFTSNKLYQIYKCPSLMDDFTFTDESIEEKANSFKSRRKKEEVLNMQYRKIKG